jgi:hypothetical protein
VAKELQACDTFIYGKLAADALLAARVATVQPTGPPTLRIYKAALVPQAAVTPYVSFGLLSSLDRNALPATVTLFTRPIYFVRAVIQGNNMTDGYFLQDRIDAALRNQFGNVVIGAETYYIGPWFRNALRELPPEFDGSLKFTQVGGEFESRVERLS